MHDEVRGGDQRKGINSGRSVAAKKHSAPSANREVAKNKWWQATWIGDWHVQRGSVALLPKQAG